MQVDEIFIQLFVRVWNIINQFFHLFLVLDNDEHICYIAINALQSLFNISFLTIIATDICYYEKVIEELRPIRKITSCCQR